MMNKNNIFNKMKGFLSEAKPAPEEKPEESERARRRRELLSHPNALTGFEKLMAAILKSPGEKMRKSQKLVSKRRHPPKEKPETQDDGE